MSKCSTTRAPTSGATREEIGDENIELLLIEFLECFLGVVGADGAITLHFQDFATEASENFMVVDEENSFHGAYLRRRT